MTTIGRAGGSDTIPVTYANPVTTNIRVDETDRWLPTYNPVVKATPTFDSIQVNGPSNLWAQMAAQFGTVTMRITRSNLSSGAGPVPGTPAYIDVVVNGCWAKMEVGVTLTGVPRNFYDAINTPAGPFAAVLV